MSDRNRQKQSLKKQRRQEIQAKRRQRLIRIGVVTVVGAILIGAIIFRFAYTSIAGEVDQGTQERGHDEEVVIDSGDLPQAGGVHSPRWQNCGIYDEPVESKNAIHSMEHGAVWITYRPELPDEDVATLRDLVRGQTYLLLSPHPGLRSPVALTAWGIQLEVDSVDDERVAGFIEKYRLGPQTPEFGAACTGGVGSPIG